MRLPSVSRAGGMGLDRDSLSSMKVSELRALCKEKGLLVSGKKEELISRLLGKEVTKKSPETKVTSASLEHGKDDAIDRLLARFETGGAGMPEDEAPEPAVESEEVLEVEVIEAEIVEAEIEPEAEEELEIVLDGEEEEPTLEVEPEILLDDDDDPWTGGVVAEEGEPALVADEIESPDGSDASITITIPSLSSIEFSPKVIGAITISALILGAIGFTIFMQQDSSFQARNLHYGDSMQFNILSSSIEVEGDDMVAIFRDAASGPLDDACGELTAEINSGTGSISIREGAPSEIIHPSDQQFSGAVSALDAFGRIHLAAEEIITHEMNFDLSGKTWREEGDCGNLGWVLEDNFLDMTTKTWTDIGDKQLIRTSTDLTISDEENRATNFEATTFGLDAISGLGVVSSYVFLPLTPLDLHEFFGDASLTSGSTSEVGSEWSWSVGNEMNDNNHGLVYPISMSHSEFDSCNGHITIDLLVKSSVPWPVQQDANIVIDKNLKSSDCGLIESSLSDAAIPDGRISISFSMRATSTNSGSSAIEWLVDYTSKPGPGEDRPGTSAQRSWGVAMPDESSLRAWNLESALECTLANYSTSGVATAIEQGGYVWRASTVMVDTNIQWNMSWVTEDERAGWTVVQEDNGGCSLVDDENMDDGTVQWNRNAIPDTLTMNTLESRLLSSSRYPGLNIHINDGIGGWDDDVEYGFRLSVTEDNEIFDVIPISLGEGAVSVYAEKSWTDDNNRNHDVVCVMDAENARLLGWYHFWTPPN
ncbi:MAG: SAP domain-containing protein [Candidatus Thermoplasmatota archaeon]|nr:SAP domain-containing protein [Candidatus Thermoplasmatota archaeon]